MIWVLCCMIFTEQNSFAIDNVNSFCYYNGKFKFCKFHFRQILSEQPNNLLEQPSSLLDQQIILLDQSDHLIWWVQSSGWTMSWWKNVACLLILICGACMNQYIVITHHKCDYRLIWSDCWLFSSRLLGCSSRLFGCSSRLFGCSSRLLGNLNVMFFGWNCMNIKVWCILHYKILMSKRNQ